MPATAMGRPPPVGTLIAAQWVQLINAAGEAQLLRTFGGYLSATDVRTLSAARPVTLEQLVQGAGAPRGLKRPLASRVCFFLMEKIACQEAPPADSDGAAAGGADAGSAEHNSGADGAAAAPTGAASTAAAAGFAGDAAAAAAAAIASWAPGRSRPRLFHPEPAEEPNGSAPGAATTQDAVSVSHDVMEDVQQRLHDIERALPWCEPPAAGHHHHQGEATAAAGGGAAASSPASGLDAPWWHTRPAQRSPALRYNINACSVPQLVELGVLDQAMAARLKEAMVVTQHGAGNQAPEDVYPVSAALHDDHQRQRTVTQQDYKGWLDVHMRAGLSVPLISELHRRGFFVAPSGARHVPLHCVDLNGCSADVLRPLLGEKAVEQRVASRLIAERQARGPFTSLASVLRIQSGNARFAHSVVSAQPAVVVVYDPLSWLLHLNTAEVPHLTLLPRMQAGTVEELEAQRLVGLFSGWADVAGRLSPPAWANLCDVLRAADARLDLATLGDSPTLTLQRQLKRWRSVLSGTERVQQELDPEHVADAKAAALLEASQLAARATAAVQRRLSGVARQEAQRLEEGLGPEHLPDVFDARAARVRPWHLNSLRLLLPFPPEFSARPEDFGGGGGGGGCASAAGVGACSTLKAAFAARMRYKLARPVVRTVCGRRVIALVDVEAEAAAGSAAARHRLLESSRGVDEHEWAAQLRRWSLVYPSAAAASAVASAGRPASAPPGAPLPHGGSLFSGGSGGGGSGTGAVAASAKISFAHRRATLAKLRPITAAAAAAAAPQPSRRGVPSSSSSSSSSSCPWPAEPGGSRSIYALDVFGNVVVASLRPTAHWGLGGLLWDCIFPADRGGHVRPSNLLPCHTAAAQLRHGRLFQTLERVHGQRDPLQLGLTEQQLRTLWACRCDIDAIDPNVADDFDQAMRTWMEAVTCPAGHEVYAALHQQTDAASLLRHLGQHLRPARRVVAEANDRRWRGVLDFLQAHFPPSAHRRVAALKPVSAAAAAAPSRSGRSSSSGPLAVAAVVDAVGDPVDLSASLKLGSAASDEAKEQGKEQTNSDAVNSGEASSHVRAGAVEEGRGPSFNLNTCSQEMLCGARDIDKKLANRLLQERSDRGPFADWRDLEARVSYFGKARTTALQNHGFFIAPPPAGGAGDASAVARVNPTAKPSSGIKHSSGAAAAPRNRLSSVDGGASEADSIKALRWWLRPGESSSAPFPSEFNLHRHYSGSSRKWEYDVPALDPEGSFPPAEVAHTRQKQLEANFPKVTREDDDSTAATGAAAASISNGRETKQQRIRATSRPEARSSCWARCSVDGIPRDLSKEYRLDMYGNIVAKEATQKAVCAFDVDHIFPWCRGGMSVDANFAAVQWYANEVVKKDQILQAACARRDFVVNLSCGLQVEQLLALYRLRDGIKKRYEKNRFSDRLKTLLVSVRYELPMKELPQVPADERVFFFLEEHYSRSMTSLFKAVLSSPLYQKGAELGVAAMATQQPVAAAAGGDAAEPAAAAQVILS